MSTISHHHHQQQQQQKQQLKRTYQDQDDDHHHHLHHHHQQLTLSTINCPSKNIRQIRNYCDEEEKLINPQRCKRSSCDWSLNHRKKIKRTSEKRASQLEDNDDEHLQYHCFVFLKFYSSTLKCSIDVLVKSTDQVPTDQSDDDQQSILIGKSRISRSIKPGVIRIRLVSSLFTADSDVHEDPSLIKLETIRNQKQSNHFDKQFALLFKNDRFGPGTIGKLFIESLDPQTGSYTNNPPIFELNLTLASEQKILLTSFDQKINNDSICVSSSSCGCVLSSDSSRINISDKCNLKLNDTKLIHRLAEPLRCQWKSIGRELYPCFNETDLTDFHQSYFINEGNQECTYQLLREWFIRDPQQANIRYLLTRLKLSYESIVTIHNDVLIPYLS